MKWDIAIIMTNELSTFQNIEHIAEKLTLKLQHKPEIAILDDLGCESLCASFPKDQPEDFHLGLTASPYFCEMRWGYFHGLAALYVKGLLCQYEGASAQDIALSVRILSKMGVHTIVILNECISISQLIRPSTLFFVQDHINLTGSNPLTGPNDESIGPRFPDMSAPYNRTLLEFAEKSAVAVEYYQHSAGVVAGIAGPSLPTSSEARMYQRIGAQVVSMSGVPQTIAAVHAGVRVLTISAVTRQILPDSSPDQQSYVPFDLHSDVINLTREVLRNVAAGTR